jgi:hypothetical protein
MQASHFECRGVAPFDPHCLFNPVMIRRTYAANRTGIGTRNWAISATRLQSVIDRLFRFAEAHEAYSYFADHRRVGKVVISGD